MTLNERFAMLRVCVDNSWYTTYETEREMIDRIKYWEKEIAKTEYMHKLYPQWFTELTHEDQENLIRRNIALMKIVILRAHNYVVDDFKQFDNPFYRRLLAKP